MRQGLTWLTIRRGIRRRRYLFRCSTTELHGSKAMAGIEPATFGVRRNPRLHHRRKLYARIP